MNERSGFYRKIAYVGAMAVLLVPLSMLGLPRTIDDQGGVIAQLRDEYELGQADLGEIDPASATMKLATFGLRGVAVNLLWGQANEYKKTENWSKLTATLDQLSKLQPNFVTFWKFQAWNQSYNLSVEFDDYRDRYYYVRRGIEFMEKGQRYNRDNTQLLWELGWFVGYKIGRADEVEQYRRLFKADDEYHGERPLSQRDNWLVGKQWYERSVIASDDKGRGYGKKSPVVFYSSAPKWQMNYADAIESEGEFDRARQGWEIGEREWNRFGNREVKHSLGGTVRLGQEEFLTNRVAELQQKLDGLHPKSIDNLKAKLRSALTPEQLAALDKTLEEGEEWDERALTLRYEAESKLAYDPLDLAEQIAQDQPKLRNEALQTAADLEAAAERLRFTKSYKDTANYDYWLTRTKFEQTDDAIAARKLIFQADQAFTQDLKPEAAKPLYEQSFLKWRTVLDQFEDLKDPEGTTGDDLMIFIKDYYRVLEQLDESIPDDFPLWDIIEAFDLEGDFREQIADRQQRLASEPADEEKSSAGAVDMVPKATDNDRP